MGDQLRQVLDEYDCVQQQLEVEVSAHLACQQELEKSQWVADTILNPEQQSTARDKTWKNISNQKESQSGHILDVVQKARRVWPTASIARARHWDLRQWHLLE